MSKIRILIADGSTADIEACIAILDTDPETEVVGTAKSGKQAIALARDLRPDILAIAESIQNMDLLETIKQVMAYTPTPILILVEPGRKIRSENVLKALSMGALDVIEMPVAYCGAANLKQTDSRGGSAKAARDKARCAKLIKTVKFLSNIRVVTHVAGRLERNGIPTYNRDKNNGASQYQNNGSRSIIAIAASTGGPGALIKILGGVPAGMDMCIVIVQHIADGFSSGLADWLNKESKVEVKEAQDGERLEHGYAYLAPTGFHMMVTGAGRVRLSETPPIAGHRPAADVLFTSVAKSYGRDSVGIILTGMGTDGAKGIVAIKKAGGRTIVQDEESCVVFGMPRAAIQTGAVDEVIPLDHIAERIGKFHLP